MNPSALIFMVVILTTVTVLTISMFRKILKADSKDTSDS